MQDGIVLPRYELAEDEIDLIRHKGKFYARMEYDEDRTMIIEFEDKEISDVRFE